MLFDLEVYLIGMGHESRRNCYLFGKSRDLKVIIQHYPMLCFSFDSSSVVKDSADNPLRGSIWRRAGAGLMSLWRVQRKPDKDSAGRPSTSQSFNGAMADPSQGTTPVHVSNQSLIYGNQHNMPIRPYSCLLVHMVPFIDVQECLLEWDRSVSLLTHHLHSCRVRKV